ncbi:hypothetical protein ACIGKQ_16625 [Gordonia sp. NPDC062954]|uniref:hypothetical protein n=1 Tax=unclassified Gordonia (in: high G+C Gram-positive bacteria) TaxID=2657482 RepID=UPI00257BB627|nr:hypothetical protein [Gordonia sp. (in: high G+C Gram-positive bacteria)]
MTTTLTRAPRSRTAALVPPVLYLGLIYYFYEPDALKIALIFPPTFLWWPGIPAALLAASWAVSDRTLAAWKPELSGEVRYIIGAYCAAVSTLAVGFVVMRLAGGSASQNILDIYVPWGVGMVPVSAAAAWAWAKLADEH